MSLTPERHAENRVREAIEVATHEGHADDPWVYDVRLVLRALDAERLRVAYLKARFMPTREDFDNERDEAYEAMSAAGVTL
jgi:hypothetical protein